MKKLFITSKSNSVVDLSKINLSKFPKKIALFYSVQFEEQAKKLKNFLSGKKEITSFSQVLGCSFPKLDKNTEAVLLVGSGKFHALSLAVNYTLPVFILQNNSVLEISREEIAKFQQKQKSHFMKYLNSDKIGILISTKPGQQNLKKAFEFSDKLSKISYLYIGNEINSSEFENFPEIECWVNTACPRLDMNNFILNFSKISKH